MNLSPLRAMSNKKSRRDIAVQRNQANFLLEARSDRRLQKGEGINSLSEHRHEGEKGNFEESKYFGSGWLRNFSFLLARYFSSFKIKEWTLVPGTGLSLPELT